jgi:hypothetical protein
MIHDNGDDINAAEELAVDGMAKMCNGHIHKLCQLIKFKTFLTQKLLLMRQILEKIFKEVSTRMLSYH